MAIMAGNNKKNNQKEGTTNMGTPLSTLITAAKGGEVRIDSLIQFVTDNVTPARDGIRIIDELKGIKDLLGALKRGIENIE
jgi:hypothetical protein